jgi:hypothetical protein
MVLVEDKVSDTLVVSWAQEWAAAARQPGGSACRAALVAAARAVMGEQMRAGSVARGVGGTHMVGGHSLAPSPRSPPSHPVHEMRPVLTEIGCPPWRALAPRD